VGAGAAGLATAIFAARRMPGRVVVALDGAARPGAKILISGGARCNVTNVAVGERDFWGGRRSIVRRVLRSFPAEQAAAFFRELGVALHAEDDGKLFPDSGRARTVLEALLREVARRGVRLQAGRRVTAVVARPDGYELETSAGPLRARRLVLATGGLSLPKTGSDGLGYRLAQALGHSLVDTTPALAPLLLEGGLHAGLSGVSCEAELLLRPEGADSLRLRGPLLFTHFGVSGPVALNASRHWHRARLEGRAVQVSASFLPGRGFAEAERLFERRRSGATLQTALAAAVPASLGAALAREAALDPAQPLARLTREARRGLAHALVGLPLRVRDSRGYAFAEVTAGGVPLEEIDAATMESRRSGGLHLAGEILDVDGRLGGFNFQWAWSSGWVAAGGLARAL
jgi:predicted Rossmann fold flavoprotein